MSSDSSNNIIETTLSNLEKNETIVHNDVIILKEENKHNEEVGEDEEEDEDEALDNFSSNLEENDENTYDEVRLEEGLHNVHNKRLFSNIKSDKDKDIINQLRDKLTQQYKEVGINRDREARATFRFDDNNDSEFTSSKKFLRNYSRPGFQNSTLSFFNRRSRRYSNINYPDEIISKWFNFKDNKEITLHDKLCFYFNSLHNNKCNKFKFIQYMGELTMMYEDSTKLLSEIKKKEIAIFENQTSIKHKGPLYFLYENDDDINCTFRRIDVFLKRHIQFMKLCSAPVDMFLDNYFAARGNCCGLIEITQSTSLSCLSKGNTSYNSIYINYNDCKDNELKHDFLIEMEGSYFEGSDRVYATNRRIAALHNILGELHAISEFIKTTVDMNDQLLFRLLMLLGSFLTLLGEFVWNTHVKKHYYD